VFAVTNDSWSPDGRFVIAQFDTDLSVWLLDPNGIAPPQKAPCRAGPESWPAG
jgi:hypothetical protein